MSTCTTSPDLKVQIDKADLLTELSRALDDAKKKAPKRAADYEKVLDKWRADQIKKVRRFADKIELGWLPENKYGYDRRIELDDMPTPPCDDIAYLTRSIKAITTDRRSTFTISPGDGLHRFVTGGA